MKKQTILPKFACGLLPLLLSGCALPDLESLAPPPALESPADTPTSSSTSPTSAVGTWGGTVAYQHNGQTVLVTRSIVRIPPSKDRVEHALQASGETSSPEITSAQWSGNTVSWTSPADRSFTEWHLTPISSRTARVTSSCHMINHGFVIRGSGTFTRQ